VSWVNVEIVGSNSAAWSRGDFSSVEWADPEIEYVIVDGPEPGSCRGRVAMAETMRSILNPWEDLASRRTSTSSSMMSISSSSTTSAGEARRAGWTSGR
jgi:hypothetical protein